MVHGLGYKGMSDTGRGGECELTEPEHKDRLTSDAMQTVPSSAMMAVEGAEGVDGVAVADNVRAVFERVDRNRDEQLTRAELIRALRRDVELQELLELPAHIGDDQRTVFEAVFQRMDKDDGRSITLQEFAEFVRRAHSDHNADTAAAELALTDLDVADLDVQHGEPEPEPAGVSSCRGLRSVHVAHKTWTDQMGCGID
jgi:hypothetical protein